MTWATAQQVQILTGITPADDVLEQAHAVVELFVGISQDNTTELSGGNARLLRCAVAYQAAWMTAQVDVLGRMEVSQLQQDGAVVQPGSGEDLLLAPLAKRAIARLSWMWPRGTALTTDCGARYGRIEEYAAAWVRDETRDAWRAL